MRRPQLTPPPTHPVQAYTRSIAYDPEGAYIVAVGADGSLNVWEIEGGKHCLGRKKACPKVGAAAGARGGCGGARGSHVCGAPACQPSSPPAPRMPPSPLLQVDLASTARLQAAWHPDGGSLLAAPGADGGDIQLYERMSWEAVCSLGGQHTAHVSLLAFSANGAPAPGRARSQGLARCCAGAARAATCASPLTRVPAHLPCPALPCLQACTWCLRAWTRRWCCGT